jgi:hypothetical protein
MLCATKGQLLHSDRSSSSEHSSSSSGRTSSSSRGFFGETAYPSGLFHLQVDLPQGGTACITTPGAAAGAAVAGTCGVHSMWSWINTDITANSDTTVGASLMSFWHTAEGPAHSALLLSHSDWAVHAAPAYTAPLSRKRAAASAATTAAGAAALHRQAVITMSDSPPVRWTLHSGKLVLLVPDRNSGSSSSSGSGSSRSELCIAVPDGSSDEGTCSIDGDDSSSDGEDSAVELKLQPAALRGCATVNLKPLPPFQLQGGDGFGQCLAVTAQGHTWVDIDKHNPRLRWSVAPASIVSCLLTFLYSERMLCMCSLKHISIYCHACLAIVIIPCL